MSELRFSGFIKRLKSFTALLISGAGDYIVTASGDNILISANPYSDLSGTITAENVISGTLEADTITGTITAETMRGAVSGSVKGAVR